MALLQLALPRAEFHEVRRALEKMGTTTAPDMTSAPLGNKNEKACRGVADIMTKLIKEGKSAENRETLSESSEKLKWARHG